MNVGAASRLPLHVAEPPAVFLARPPMVVDRSGLSAVLFREEPREEALRIMAGRALHAPFLLATEFASVAVKKSRGGWPQPRVRDALALYVQQEIELHQPKVQAL